MDELKRMLDDFHERLRISTELSQGHRAELYNCAIHIACHAAEIGFQSGLAGKRSDEWTHVMGAETMREKS